MWLRHKVYLVTMYCVQYPTVLSDYQPIGQVMAESPCLRKICQVQIVYPHARYLMCEYFCNLLSSDLHTCDNNSLLFGPLSPPALLELPVPLPGALASTSSGALTVTPPLDLSKKRPGVFLCGGSNCPHLVHQVLRLVGELRPE